MENELAERILKYRAKYNLSVVKFAKLCGVSATTIYEIEKGYSSCSRWTKQKILNVLDK